MTVRWGLVVLSCWRSIACLLHTCLFPPQNQHDWFILSVCLGPLCKYPPLCLSFITIWCTIHIAYIHGIFTIESQQLPVNAGRSFIFVHQKLYKRLFHALQHGWEQFIHFELNTMHTTVFTRPYSTAYWSLRNRIQFGISTTSRSQHLHKILVHRHYSPIALCVFLAIRHHKIIWNSAFRCKILRIHNFITCSGSYNCYVPFCS